MTFDAIQLKAMAVREKILRESEQEEEIRMRNFYRENPLNYFSDRLGIRPETINWQLNESYKSHKWDGTENPFMQILKAIHSNKWIGVESATGTGKTHFGALLVLWFLECWENSIVITTAPKQDQLALHIWKEIGILFPKFGRGELTQLRLRMSPGEDRWLAIGFVAGIKANEESSTKAQGFHAEHMLIILEETPGIPMPVITAFENTCTSSHNIILALGNPDNQFDNLHQFCLMDGVEHIRISAYDHPNVVLDDPSFIPGACTRTGIERIENRFGKGSGITLSRTRGLSPSQGENSLIRLDWCLKAIENRDTAREIIPGAKALGVDVANSEAGDKASIAFGIGNRLEYVESFTCTDSNQLGHRVYRLMKDEDIHEDFVAVDGIGVGAGTVNTLKEYGIKSRKINIQSAGKPVRSPGEEEFLNLRSQMWWQMREDLRLGLVTLPNDQELLEDLTVPTFEVRLGKIVVENKNEIRKRLQRSTNKGDAVVYWNWQRLNRNRIKNVRAVKRLY